MRPSVFFLIFSYASFSSHCKVDIFIELQNRYLKTNNKTNSLTHHLCGKRAQAVGTINIKLQSNKRKLCNWKKCCEVEKHWTFVFVKNDLK